PYQDVPLKNERTVAPMSPEPLTEFSDDAEQNRRAWAEGLLTDSSGNAAFGKEQPDGSITDQRSLIHNHPGIAGCKPVRPSTTGHMNPALIGTTGPGAGAAYLNS